MEPLKVVCIGGGTGLSTMLKGLKEYTDNLTAVVTMADNGGSSGHLRKDLNILPPGDIRNCLAALAETEPMMEALIQHRFSDGALKGHSFGNLFIAGLADMLGHFGLAVEKAHEVLRVKGKVVPVTLEDVQLKAFYDDGSEVVGETEIVAANKSHRKRIKNMTLVPSRPDGYHKAIDAIRDADMVILGPGSLYTSIVPNLLVEGICDAIQASEGQVVYVCNLMTQPGETDDFTLLEHVQIIEEYLGHRVVDHIVANDNWPGSDTIDHYDADGAQLVLPLTEDPRITSAPLLTLDQSTGFIRHDTDKLAKVLISL